MSENWRSDSTPLVLADDHDAVVYSGNWTNGITEDFDAALQISFFGEEITVRFTIFDRQKCCWHHAAEYAPVPSSPRTDPLAPIAACCHESNGQVPSVALSAGYSLFNPVESVRSDRSIAARCQCQFSRSKIVNRTNNPHAGHRC